MPSTDISYTTRQGETFTGYLSRPDGDGSWPGILMITAIFGIDDEMQELADAWAADGFVVSVPDIFWRVMPGPTADMEKAFGRYNDFDFDKGIDDVEDLLGDLRGRPECNGKVAVMGFCFGGPYALLGASRLGCDAGISFHGSHVGKFLDEFSAVRCPLSFHYGDNDAVAPMTEITEIKAALEGLEDTELHIYPGAEHGYMFPSRGDGYDAAARDASWDRALAVLRRM